MTPPSIPAEERLPGGARDARSKAAGAANSAGLAARGMAEDPAEGGGAGGAEGGAKGGAEGGAEGPADAGAGGPAARAGSDSPSVAAAAARIAELLTRGGGGLQDPGRGDLLFEASLEPLPLARLPEPADAWAVDGGQALVADARCLQLYVTRASRVRFQRGAIVLEEEGELRAHLIGCGEERSALAVSAAPVEPQAPVDANLLRDWSEWETVARTVEEAEAGAVVLVDGDLQPDWRIRSSWLAELLERAAERSVLLAGVTKHSSLARGGAPLVGQLEQAAEATLGPRARWWVPVARTRADLAPGIQVAVARLDPDARFAFRVDLPAGADPEAALGALSALCDDAAFPGYPYPLSIADSLASCAGWLKDEVLDELLALLASAGVPSETVERAFADRHRLMER